MSEALSERLSERIEAIEAGYEFMLAYAAQGYEPNQGGNHEHDIRRHLDAMRAALDGLGAVAEAAAGARGGLDHAPFVAVLSNDAAKAAAAIGLAANREGISSQLIDNLNASSHLRALLTDLFLLDEAIKT